MENECVGERGTEHLVVAQPNHKTQPKANLQSNKISLIYSLINGVSGIIITRQWRRQHTWRNVIFLTKQRTGWSFTGFVGSWALSEIWRIRGFRRFKADWGSLPSIQYHICLTKWTQGPASLANAKEKDVVCSIRTPYLKPRTRAGDWGGFCLSKWLTHSRQEGDVSFLLIGFQTTRLPWFERITFLSEQERGSHSEDGVVWTNRGLGEILLPAKFATEFSSSLRNIWTDLYHST